MTYSFSESVEGWEVEYDDADNDDDGEECL